MLVQLRKCVVEGSGESEGAPSGGKYLRVASGRLGIVEVVFAACRSRVGGRR